jgi:hypothetical protein
MSRTRATRLLLARALERREAESTAVVRLLQALRCKVQPVVSFLLCGVGAYPALTLFSFGVMFLR